MSKRNRGILLGAWVPEVGSYKTGPKADPAATDLYFFFYPEFGRGWLDEDPVPPLGRYNLEEEDFGY